MTMRVVDRDGNPIETDPDQAGEVESFPIPEDVPDRILMSPVGRSSGSHRRYHRRDPDDPDRPACEYAGYAPETDWKEWSSHGLEGNFPPCTHCFPGVDDTSEEAQSDDGQQARALPGYQLNWELRREICRLAGVPDDELSRYAPRPDGRRIRKSHLYQVARTLGDPPGDGGLTLPDTEQSEGVDDAE